MSETIPDTTTEPEASGAQGSGRRRSAATYPYYNLKEAIRFADAVEKAGGNEAAEDDVLRVLGLTTKANKAWTYRASSAREFGLVQKQARFEDRVRLTDAALRYLRPSSDEERTAALLALLLSPPLYKDLIQHYRGAPLQGIEFIANLLVRKHGILSSVSVQAATAFRESVEFAGLVDNNGRVRVPEDGVQPSGGAKSEIAVTATEVQTPSPPESARPNMKRIEVPDSYIVHEFPLRRNTRVWIPLPDDLTEKDVERLYKWLGTLPYDETENE